MVGLGGGTEETKDRPGEPYFAAYGGKREAR